MRLKRFGTKKRPYYRVVIMDSHRAISGKVIDEIGLYHPVEAEDKQIEIDADKAVDWIAKGAVPSTTVKGLLNRKGISLAPSKAQ